MTECMLLYVTCPSTEVARAIGTQLIDQRLAACINVLPAITSLYEWQGKLEQSSEVIMIVKTAASRAADATALIAKAHPYDCPCVLQLPISGGHALFLDWICKQTEPL